MENKIITISGEQKDEKEATIKELIQNLEGQGYSKEQIHLESTGDNFRKLFNSIVDLFQNLNNDEEMKKIIEREELQDIFEYEGYRKTLSKTFANLIKKDIDVSNISIEDANSIEELSAIRQVLDDIVDEETKKLGEKINEEEHPNEIWIIDSRLAFANIPENFSVRLKTPEIEEQESFKAQNKRYIEEYAIDLTDKDNYQLIVDTSYLTPHEISFAILQCFKKYEKNEEFPKDWESANNNSSIETEKLNSEDEENLLEPYEL